MRPETPFTLGNFSVCPEQSSITTDKGEQRILQTKFIDVLVYLAQNYPRLVTRQELIEKVWLGNTPVGEKALTNAIWHLRQQYKDNGQAVIETVRKRGYRLLLEPSFTTSQPTNSKRRLGKTQTNRSYAVFTAMTILILMLSSVVFWQNVYPDNQSFTVTDVTSSPGKELFPAPSPDGNQLVYVWERLNHSSDLFIKGMSKPQLGAKQLTFDEHQERRPIWSPDGKHIFFVQTHWQDNRCSIIQLALNTGTQKQITSCSVNSNVSLALSVDGTTLAYTGQNANDRNAGIYLLDLTNLDAAPIRISCNNDCTHLDRNFAFSPDKQYLAVTRRVESLVEDIFLIDRQNGTTKQLTFGAGDIVGLNWHPDGSKILFAAQSAGRRDGYVVNLSDNSIESLGIPGLSFPQFIGQSSEIVYHHKQDNEYIAGLNLNESVSALPFPLLQSRFCYATPHYNAVSQRIAYISNESGFNEVWTADIDGSNRQQMTHMNNNLFYPNWSYDGRFIAFLAPKPTKQGNELLVLNVLSGTINKLHSSFTSHKRPTWLRDSSAVMAAVSDDKHSGLYKFSLDESPPKQLLKNKVRYAVQMRDGNLLYSGAGGLNLYDIEQKTTLQLLDNDSFNVTYNWTVNDQGVYYQFSQPNHDQINFYNLSNQQVSTVVKLPGELLSNSSSMTFLGDNQTLVFNRLQLPQVDIKRLKHPLLD